MEIIFINKNHKETKSFFLSLIPLELNKKFHLKNLLEKVDFIFLFYLFHIFPILFIHIFLLLLII
jgi:hypothetical protein